DPARIRRGPLGRCDALTGLGPRALPRRREPDPRDPGDDPGGRHGLHALRPPQRLAWTADELIPRPDAAPDPGGLPGRVSSRPRLRALDVRNARRRGLRASAGSG